MWKTLPKLFIIKKKEAFKLEQIPELGHRTLYGKYHQSYSLTKGIRTCVICGVDASYVAYFQMDGHKLIEKYCQPCLSRYVIKPQIV